MLPSVKQFILDYFNRPDYKNAQLNKTDIIKVKVFEYETLEWNQHNKKIEFEKACLGNICMDQHVPLSFKSSLFDTLRPGRWSNNKSDCYRYLPSI